MPRTARTIAVGYIYHVINRANRGATLFHDPSDYDDFLRLMRRAQARARVEIFALCLMPNHFHLIVRPPDDTALSRWMQWLLTTHVRRRHQLRGTDGHLWQGRYKAFPVERDQHLLTVTRYVERNALRAGLVTRAENWPWSSASWRCRSCSPLDLTPMPIVPPGDWTEWLNEPQTATELEALRICARRQRPFGSPPWVAETATNLGLTQSLRPVGRPRKNGDCPH